MSCSISKDVRRVVFTPITKPLMKLDTISMVFNKDTLIISQYYKGISKPIKNKHLFIIK